MPTGVVHLAVDAADPPRLARFWAAAIGWEVAADEPHLANVWPAGFSYPDPAALPLVFIRVPEAKAGKNRVHLDLATTSAEHQAAQVKRLRDLGATPAGIGQGEVPWVVLADPEGNEFCVLDSRPGYRDTGPGAAVLIGCAGPAGLAGFWAEAAGGHRRDARDDSASPRPPQDTGPCLELLRTPDSQ